MRTMKRLSLVAALIVAGCGAPAVQPVASFEPSVSARLEPSNTQTKAEKRALAWSSDARQIGIGWAFYKTPLAGATTHVYHSKARKQVLIVAFAGSSWIGKERVDADPTHAKIAGVLGTVQHGKNARLAYEAAVEAGLTRRDRMLGALLRPPIPRVPGLWVLHVDDPQVLINDSTGKPVLKAQSELERFLIREWFDPFL